MLEVFKIFIGIVVLLFGIPIGSLLAHFTKEELKDGRKWFRRIIFLSLVGGFVGLILGNDALLFSLFFVAIVTSQSLRKV